MIGIVGYIRLHVYRSALYEDRYVYIPAGYNKAMVWSMGGGGKPLYAIRVVLKSPPALPSR